VVILFGNGWNSMVFHFVVSLTFSATSNILHKFLKKFRELQNTNRSISALKAHPLYTQTS
jgi:hypothetical protein